MGTRQSSKIIKMTTRRKAPIFVDGFVKQGFEKVKERFRHNLETELEVGGTFSAYYKGELVVNLWGGYADREARRYWSKDTLPCFYSTTKSASAVVIAHLVDRGVLDYKEKVCKYWPDFAVNGKDNVTLETLICNQAGLSITEEKFKMALVQDDPEKLGKILANQKPLWEPGTNHGYHPITFALYLDQIVRRVDPLQRSLAQYFHQEIALPFDIEFYIGVPYELQYRTPRITMLKQFDSEDYIKNFKGDLSILRLTAVNPTDFIGVKRMNDPEIKVLPVGSVCGHGTAQAVAKLHAILANGGTWQGKRLLSEDSIARFQQIKSAGYDLAFSMDGMWSYGTMVFPVKEIGKPTMFLFGHGGYGGQMGLADANYNVGLAYATNYLDPTSRAGADADKRWPSMYNSLYECIRKIENQTAHRRTLYVFEDYKKAKGSLM
ncbi:hypothetical protein FSP39_015164 [Pinctada imbricata]|uniref:Beta-lactamase-related domain-containing protein n=1 Tax=Pinctada imbricata TaxID=66713 RepID=A0AA88XZ29_PINIB|nr:hypothetical protein FSP39_015164 [Pinctada imbricata]